MPVHPQMASNSYWDSSPRIWSSLAHLHVFQTCLTCLKVIILKICLGEFSRMAEDSDEDKLIQVWNFMRVSRWWPYSFLSKPFLFLFFKEKPWFENAYHTLCSCFLYRFSPFDLLFTLLKLCIMGVAVLMLLLRKGICFAKTFSKLHNLW